jgi:hypothetical protein
MPERRTRKRTLGIKPELLVERAIKFADDDEQARQSEMDIRLQRYAKFRQWRDDYAQRPWEDASDAAVSDLATASLRTQDTLYNAVMTTRPAIISKATSESDANKQDAVDQIIDYQAFVENGEEWLSDLIDAFTNDGHFTAFIPWVKEKRKSQEVQIADPIPEEVFPGEYFLQILSQLHPEAQIVPRGDDPLAAWDFEVVTQEEILDVAFYTGEEDQVEIVTTRNTTVFDGPKIIVKDRSDVLHPAQVSNLQIPGPSNPGGAPHVILVDHQVPLDEIFKLQKTGFYDQLTKDDVEELKGRINTESSQPSAEAEQKATIGGADDLPNNAPLEHRTVKRYVVFDTIDVSGNGEVEDVVYWVLENPKKLLRMRRLSEVYPGRIPRRPFAEQQFIPVRGQRTGIGILELGEGLHDLRKQLMDQSIDAGTLGLGPFFFYRPSSSMKPETIRLFPGEGYPLSDPKNDVNFPTINQQGQAYAFNMLSIIDRDSERLNMVGDLQLGRVPEGKASALRTVRGMAMIQSQGEARPARILRRFFTGLSQIWYQIHELNRHLLPAEKQIRIVTVKSDTENPYRVVKKTDLDGTFTFEFEANVFNTSKEILQETLGQLFGLYTSPLAFQTGISNEKTVYNLMYDLGKSFGQDPEKYINSPVMQEMISFEEAIGLIMDDQIPQGFPQEGPEQHLTMLKDFAESEQFGLLSQEQIEVFAQWGELVQGLMVELQRIEQLSMASQAEQVQGGGGEEGRPPEGGPVDQEQATLQDNENVNENLDGGG